jgi:hypothetical protein
MRQLNFSHNTNSTPPPLLPVVEKVKSGYKNWIPIHRNMPRTERFGIGLKVDILFLDLLELLRKATYTPTQQKIAILEDCLNKTDSLRFFIQIMWETRLMTNTQFASLGNEIENIGKMIGGWRKGLLTKLPP